MNAWEQLIQNQVLLSAASGWLAAQILKTLIHIIITRSFDPERLVGAGGMPSSHSATVCALATATARVYGFGSFEFAMASIFAFIVMYDAMGVRLETGKQAKIINDLVSIFKSLEDVTLSKKLSADKLKEFVGHTPLQVLVGAILGILIGILLK